MKRIFLFLMLSLSVSLLYAQTDQQIAKEYVKDDTKQVTGKDFTIEKRIAATPVKNQSLTGTCWSFAGTSLIESQFLKRSSTPIDLSEMFTVRNMYVEKARNYITRQGHTQFGEGGLGHDVIRSIAKYGAIPESAYSGLINGNVVHNHSKMVVELKKFLDSMMSPKLKLRGQPTISPDWMTAYNKVMDNYLGPIPTDFLYNNKKYTPVSFAKEVLNFDADDYVNITSFTHQPYYRPFIIDVPDNFSNGSYYNLPLNEMIELVKNAVKNGYSVLWDADVSNIGFRQSDGLALNLNVDSSGAFKENFNADYREVKWDASIRQKLFENLTTQDDHLMHIVGIEKSKTGKTFFIVKNSWGNIGPFQGYINVSESYFAINTISLVIPKAGIDKMLLLKLGIPVK